VVDYQAQFEKLGNRVIGLPADAILNCFISGLLPDIRNEIAIQRPQTITQAIGLAKLIESKLKDSRNRFTKPLPSVPTTACFHKPYVNPTLTNHTTTPPTTSKQPTSTPTPKLPIKRLNQT
jgi:hypothetical protein